MKLANGQDVNPLDYVDLSTNRSVYTSMLNFLMSPEDTEDFKDKMNARIMAEPDFEEDHLMKDSDLRDMARQAFVALDEEYREPYADWIANLPK